MRFEKVQIGPHTLYHGDCLEVLPTLSDPFDALVSDPPYGISHQSHGQIFARATEIAGDDSLDVAEAARLWAKEKNIACLMFFSPYKPMTGWRNVLCWNKGAHVGIGGERETCWKRDFELIGVERNGHLAGGRDSAVLRFNALSPPPSGHFAEKPVDLMKYLLAKLDCKYVIDPFMGSGSTGVGCSLKGIKFVGVECERKYFDVACRRIDEAEGKGGLFEGVE